MTGNLFELVAPSGSIIDVAVDLILSDNEVAPTAYVVAAGITGYMCFLSLDGAAVYTPVSLSTLAV
jgi:hypothetical protein